MPRPRFSEMLVARRRQLGISITQASKTLKLKEQALIAFEEGDFENIPQSGYAQGMLSSYARYLGLNPREVVDLFQEEVFEHEHGTYSHELRRKTRDTQSGRGISGYDVPNEAESRPKAYVQYHGLLPTAGGPAGDMGAFATTSGVRSRQSSVPLASSSNETNAYSFSEYATGHAYNASVDTSQRQNSARARTRGVAARRRVGIAGVSGTEGSSRLIRETQSSSYPPSYDQTRMMSRGSRLGSRSDVSTRSVGPSEYVDDLHYDDPAAPYERASTISGRRGSRNIARVDRPNVRRRQPAGSSPRTMRRPRRRGILGALDEFFSNPAGTIATIVIALAIILTLIIIFSVRTCTASKTNPVPSRTVSVNSESKTQEKTSSTNASDTNKTTDTKKDSSESKKPETTTETKADTKEVEISVPEGQASWLEVNEDGTYTVADKVTGPWSKKITVKGTLKIQSGVPGAVTVKVNGETKAFEINSQGVGVMTIKGSDTDNTSSDATNSTTSTESSKTTTSSENSQGSSNTGAKTSSTSTSSSNTSSSSTN